MTNDTTITADRNQIRTRRRRTLRRLATAALYAGVRGAATAGGGALITCVIWLITHR